MKKIIGIMIVNFLLSQFLSAKIIDYIDNAATWTKEADASIVINTVSDTEASNNSAIKIEYNLNYGSWVQIKKNFSNQDLSSGDSLMFYIKGSGAKNDIELKLFDEDGDIATYNYSGISNLASWTQIVVPFVNFNIWRKSDGTPYGDGVLNIDKITKVGFGVTKNEGSSGSVYIDELSLYQFNTPDILLVDNCETRTNMFNGVISTHTGLSTGCVIGLYLENTNPSPKSGNYYKINYKRLEGYDSRKYATVNEWFGSKWYGGNSIDVSGYSYVNFYMMVDEDYLEKLEQQSLTWILRIEMFYDGPSANDPQKCGGNLAISDFGGLSSSWKFYSIPLSSFTTLDKSQISEIKFTIWPDSDAEAIFYIDHIWFSSYPVATTDVGVVKVIDDFEDTVHGLNYFIYKDKNATCDMDYELNGYSGGCMKLEYDFKDGSWIVAERNSGLNLANCKALKFKFKGSGASNNLELKIEDTNGVIYYKNLKNVTNTSNVWKDVFIPIEEITFFAYGNNNDASLDLKNIKTIYFAISKSAGGRGECVVDTLECVSKAVKVVEGEKGIIASIIIDNNPFSPNNDGIKDKARFYYTLNKSIQEVSLDIYNLKGVLVKRINVQETKLQGSYNDIIWDGTDEDNKVVKNGLYFYKFKVKDLDNKEENFKNVIGVFK